jgi:hypothetical protein
MILSNQVLCNNCGGTPYSAHRHDFQGCDCESEKFQVCVDGGMDYLRRVSGKNSNYTDMSISLDEKHCDGLMDAFTDPERNELGKLCNLVRYLRDEMDINVTQEETGE